jgi:uncharacterized protein YgiM (DUF1202 family)
MAVKIKLPKLETLIFGVFLGCVALWASSKCSNARRTMESRDLRRYIDEEREERPVRRDTVILPAPTPTLAPPPRPITSSAPTTAVPERPVVTPPPAAPNPAKPATRAVAPKTPVATPEETASPSTTAPATSVYATLYVTTDSLKMRKFPDLKSAVVTQLKLYEPVYFLNKKSDKPQQITFGKEKVTDYWVKIRTKTGKEGWVFGAGVHYYKVKR